MPSPNLPVTAKLVKVELPVTPSVPIDVTLPVESITNLLVPAERAPPTVALFVTLSEVRVEAPSVVVSAFSAPSVVVPIACSAPPTDASPVTPSEASVVLPAVSPASVVAPATPKVP